MPESPCTRCGVKVRHTEDDLYPYCDPCQSIWTRAKLINAIAEGRLEVPPLHDEEGDPVGR